MPHGDWDDMSPTMRAALKRLAATPGAVGGYARDFRGVRLATWRALQRHSYIRSPRHETIVESTWICITPGGLESIGMGPNDGH